MVVRPKTPRGDGNLKPCCTATRNSCTSSDPKPREGTETLDDAVAPRPFPAVVRPKTPRGDGNILSANSSTVPLSGRQTQNPERGRKLYHSRPNRYRRVQVVRPKTPRGDGNFITPDQIGIGVFKSSDPKPREGTETPRGWRMRCARKCRQTQNPERGRKPSWWDMDERDYRGRRTQNPERGRKPDGTELSGFYQVVVRPKTPRGDGNPHGGTWTSATIGVVGPKTPRGDGNWTQNRTGCGRCSSRQTQNPERGRKRISPATPQPRYCSMSSDPKPREGTETHRR
ncbi:hypothetical protein I027_02839 [Mycobacterium tuberculosis TKK_02_0004]|nr:hypothetical protein I027_02839 [Mycobacterium tuberculosis TKK_02_0004]